MSKQPISRGDAISGYYPEMSGPSGVKSYFDNLKGQVISGSIANSGVVYGISHTLGKVPSVVIFTPFGVVGALLGPATSGQTVGLASVSAATTTKIYVAGAKNAKFKAFLLV